MSVFPFLFNNFVKQYLHVSLADRRDALDKLPSLVTDNTAITCPRS